MMSAIYTMSIECVWGAYLKERFFRVIEVPSEMTLHDLHSYMQELTGFDDDHMSTFYVANSHRGKKVWFTETGEYDDGNDALDGGPMWDITLDKIFPLPKHKRLYYWFDFGDDWIFEIRKKGKDGLSVSSVHYPRVIQKEGPEPEQYPMVEE